MKIDSIKTGKDLRKWRTTTKHPETKGKIRREDIAAWSHYSYSRICTIEQEDEEVPPKLLGNLETNYGK